MKKQYKNILVAVDGSQQSYEAFQEAIDVAKRNDSQLKVLYVLNDKLAKVPVHLDSMTFYKSVQEYSEHIVEKIHELMNNVVIDFEMVRLIGIPKREIVKFSKENDIDLIVIGSSGVDAIEKFIQGSTTQYVVNHSPCSVLVIK